MTPSSIVHTRLAIGVLLLVATAACGENAVRRQTAAVTQRDSAGISIIETLGAAARAPIDWRIDDAPDMQLGSADGAGPEQFLWIGGNIGRFTGRLAGGIWGLSDGRTVVVDGASGELRYFDGDGRFLGKTGGAGAGPGEFQEPLLLPNLSSDSLLIRDFRRMTLYSSDGGGYRYLPPEELVGWTGAIKGVSQTGVLTLSWSTPRMGQVRQPIQYRVYWVDRRSGRAEVVTEFEKIIHSVPPHYSVEVPFTAVPSAALGAGGFFVTVGSAPEIRAFDADGRLTRIFRLAEKPRPVTRDDVDAVISNWTKVFKDVPAGQVRSIFAQMDMPDQWPAFQDIRVDREGWIWAELYRSPHETTPRWMVFDPGGAAFGTVELPRGLEVHDIGRDYVLGRWLDEDRVEYVRRYPLYRRQ